MQRMLLESDCPRARDTEELTEETSGVCCNGDLPTAALCGAVTGVLLADSGATGILAEETLDLLVEVVNFPTTDT